MTDGQQAPANGPSIDAAGPTAGGEGAGTAGTRETAQTLTGGSALDAAIEAATIAVHDAHCSPDCRESPTTMGMFTSVAEAAVRAAEPILRQAVAEEIAYRIRAELVCCHIFQETEPIRQRGDDQRGDDLRKAVNGHWICYWGEAAALLAEDAREVGRGRA